MNYSREARLVRGSQGLNQREADTQTDDRIAATAFDIPSGIVHFNTAYNAPLLNASRARLVAGAKSHPWERPSEDFFAGNEVNSDVKSELMSTFSEFALTLRTVAAAEE